MNSGKINSLAALVIFMVTLVIYLLTVAPTVSFWDSAEFISCAVTMGIPHPPGSPLLSLAGRVMSIIPFYDFRGGGFDSVAYRLNLMGAFSAAFTVMLFYLVMVRLITRISAFRGSAIHDGIIIFSASVAAFLAAFSNQFWENALETETYMPSLLLSLLAVWLTLRWAGEKENPRSFRYLFCAAYLIGLGNGIHLYVLLIAPVVVLIVLTEKPQWFSDLRLWVALAVFLTVIGATRLAGGRLYLYIAMGLFSLAGPYIIVRFSRSAVHQWTRTFLGLVLCLSLYGIGYSVYPTVVVRASKHPAINEGNPDTWKRYTEYLDREQYGQGNMYTGMFTRNAGPGYQFGFMYLRYLLEQFPKWGPVATVTFTNDLSMDYPDMKADIRDEVFIPIGLWILVFAGIFIHARHDVKRFVPFLLYFLLTSVGLILYLNMNNPQARERDYFFLGSFLVVMVWAGFGVFGVLSLIRSAVGRLERPGLTAGIVLVAGAVFATIIPVAALSNHIDPECTNYHVHDRSHNWIPLDYGTNMLDSCAPNSILFTNGDNDTYPLWYAREVLGLRRDVRIINLSLLNAPWYIKQLRDEDVTVPISYSDDFIDNRLCGDNLLSGQTRRWTLEPREVTIAGMTWNMPPDKLGAVGSDRIGILSVASLMTAHIIQETNWTRPIYFGVTVGSETMIGLYEHMTLEGMVFRLGKEAAPKDTYHVEAAALDRNIFGRYSYRGVTDPTVYKSPETTRLLYNYVIAFIRLCEKYIELGDRANALRAARGMFEYTSPELDHRILLCSILYRGGFTDEYERLVTEEIRKLPPDDIMTSLRTGIRFIEFNLPGAALMVLNPLTTSHPDNTDVLKGYIMALYQSRDYNEALKATDRLIALLPNDPEPARYREIIMKNLQTSPADTSAGEHTQ
ncbi:DUF2723 domain-containing protein [bacterium]|nr:DUF2723 domain-containing protein [bacterium]